MCRRYLSVEILLWLSVSLCAAACGGDEKDGGPEIAEGELQLEASAVPEEGRIPLDVQFESEVELDGRELPEGFEVTYSWDFGVEDSEADHSSEPAPTWRYTSFGEFEATVTVEEVLEEELEGEIQPRTASADVGPIRVDPPQFEVDLVADRYTVESGREVAFECTQTPAIEGSEFSWSIEGEQLDEEESEISRALEGEGTREVECTVTDPMGNSETVSVTIEVSPRRVPEITDVSASPRVGIPPQSVAFDSEVEYEGDDELVYSWDFGDGQTKETRSPVHRYEGAGEYHPTLNVEDGSGDSDEVELDVKMIDSEGPAVVISKPSIELRESTPAEIDFRADRVSQHHPIELEWDFDDGTTSTEVSPTHEFDTPGEYEVTATIEDSRGETDRDTRTIILE